MYRECSGHSPDGISHLPMTPREKCSAVDHSGRCTVMSSWVTKLLVGGPDYEAINGYVADRIERTIPMSVSKAIGLPPVGPIGRFHITCCLKTLFVEQVRPGNLCELGHKIGLGSRAAQDV